MSLKPRGWTFRCSLSIFTSHRLYNFQQGRLKAGVSPRGSAAATCRRKRPGVSPPSTVAASRGRGAQGPRSLPAPSPPRGLGPSQPLPPIGIRSLHLSFHSPVASLRVFILRKRGPRGGRRPGARARPPPREPPGPSRCGRRLPGAPGRRRGLAPVRALTPGKLREARSRPARPPTLPGRPTPASP